MATRIGWVSSLCSSVQEAEKATVLAGTAEMAALMPMKRPSLSDRGYIWTQVFIQVFNFEHMIFYPMVVWVKTLVYKLLYIWPVKPFYTPKIVFKNIFQEEWTAQSRWPLALFRVPSLLSWAILTLPLLGTQFGNSGSEKTGSVILLVVQFKKDIFIVFRAICQGINSSCSDYECLTFFFGFIPPFFPLWMDSSCNFKKQVSGWQSL